MSGYSHKIEKVKNETRRLIQKRINDLTRTQELAVWYTHNIDNYFSDIQEIVSNHNMIYDTDTVKIDSYEYRSSSWKELIDVPPAKFLLTHGTELPLIPSLESKSLKGNVSKIKLSLSFFG